MEERESVVYDTVAFTVERDLIVHTDAPRIFQHLTAVRIRVHAGDAGGGTYWPNMFDFYL